jgi:metal-responsive CopG/Arc/MetJ family transcriptional regulator
MKNDRPADKGIILQIPNELVETIDLLAKRQCLSRSSFIRLALLREIEKQGLCPVAA